MTPPGTVVVVPTYNERDTIRTLLDALVTLRAGPLEVLVVDDESPDGTAAQVADFAHDHPRVELLVRRGPRGRGHATHAGFRAALERGARFIVEMDADLSHAVSDIPAMLEAAATSDVVIGSRLVPGGEDRERGALRRWITVAANGYARLALGVPVRDATSGFRCYTRHALERIDPATLRMPGPSAIQETLFRAHRAGLRIAEVPIAFVERRGGRSKFAPWQVREGLLAPLRLRLGRPRA